MLFCAKIERGCIIYQRDEEFEKMSQELDMFTK